MKIKIEFETNAMKIELETNAIDILNIIDFYKLIAIAFILISNDLIGSS